MLKKIVIGFAAVENQSRVTCQQKWESTNDGPIKEIKRIMDEEINEQVRKRYMPEKEK